MLTSLSRSFFRRNKGSLFGLTSTHQVVYNLPDVDRFFAQHGSFDFKALQSTLFNRIFGVDDTAEFHEKFTTPLAKGLTATVERQFVNEAAATAALLAADVPGKAASLVSFSDRPEDMQLWERAAKVTVVAPASSAGQKQPAVAVEADLHSLLRDFGACMAIPPLYGRDFLERNPTVLADLWAFDNHVFPLLMVGLPTWLPFRIMRDGLAGRARIIEALRGLYKRIEQHENGQPVDFGVDMSDVGTVPLERSRQYIKYGISLPYRGAMDFAVLWGQNANTQPLIFWMLAYIYSTPGLLGELRRETAPFVRLSPPAPQPPTAIAGFDLAGLMRDCPLLKSAMLETLRLCSEPTSIRYVARPAAVVDGALTHRLPAGSWVSVPHYVVQRDGTIFADPAAFVPGRFLSVDDTTGRAATRYGALRPWGAGAGICKGRTFAEKEIIAIAAAVVSLWDIEPATADGRWRLPPMRPGTGVMKPAEEMRVVIRRRAVV